MELIFYPRGYEEEPIWNLNYSFGELAKMHQLQRRSLSKEIDYCLQSGIDVMVRLSPWSIFYSFAPLPLCPSSLEIILFLLSPLAIGFSPCFEWWTSVMEMINPSGQNLDTSVHLESEECFLCLRVKILDLLDVRFMIRRNPKSQNREKK